MQTSLRCCVTENPRLGPLGGGHGLAVDRAGTLPSPGLRGVLCNPFGLEAAPSPLAADAQSALQGQTGLFRFAHDALDRSLRDRRLVLGPQGLEVSNDLRIDLGKQIVGSRRRLVFCFYWFMVIGYWFLVSF